MQQRQCVNLITSSVAVIHHIIHTRIDSESWFWFTCVRKKDPIVFMQKTPKLSFQRFFPKHLSWKSGLCWIFCSKIKNPVEQVSTCKFRSCVLICGSVLQSQTCRVTCEGREGTEGADVNDVLWMLRSYVSIWVLILFSANDEMDAVCLCSCPVSSSGFQRIVDPVTFN